MRKITLIGVLMVGILLSLGACAGPGAPPETVLPVPPAQNTAPAAPAAVPVPISAAAPAPLQSPASYQAPAALAPVNVAAAAPVAEGAGDFVLSNLQITPGIVKAGGDITVTAKVMNPGGQAATNKVTLNLVQEGEACPTFVPPVQEVTLAGGASQQVTFKLTMAADSAGSYTVTVGQLTGSLAVQ